MQREDSTAKDTRIEQELLALEKRYWQALKDNDLNAALQLTDDPCIVTGAQGVASVTQEQFEEVMKSTNHRLEDFYIGDDVRVRLLNDDTAVPALHTESLKGDPFGRDRAAA